MPGTSGDNWLPRVGCDARNRVWVVWSQQALRNWDIYARSFDINPRMGSDGNGHLAVAWARFPCGSFQHFRETFDGNQWSGDMRATRTAASDWEPAVAFDSSGKLWVAYDSYRSGNYDVLVSKLSGGRLEAAKRSWPPVHYSRLARRSPPIDPIGSG